MHNELSLGIARIPAIVLVGAISLVACSSPKPRNTVVVVQRASSSTKALDSVRKDHDAELLRALPRSGAEVWRMPEMEATAIRQQAHDLQLNYVEIPSGNRPFPVVPDRSVSVASLTEQERERLSFLVGTGREYRIAEARPPLISADLFDEALDQQKQISINVPNSPVLIFTRTQLSRQDATTFTWIGTSADGGEATFVVDAQGVTGSIITPRTQYAVRPIGEGKHVITESAPADLPPDHPPVTKRPRGSAAAPISHDEPPPIDCKPKPANEIGVLVGYTTATKAAVGDLQGLAVLAAQQTNESFRQGGIDAKVTLVGAQEWRGYTDTGNIDTDLDALVKGNIPGVTTARVATAADVVMLLSTDLDGCGASKVPPFPATRKTAYAVVSQTCAVQKVSFAHELGHLLGNRHNVERDKANKPFPAGHGYILPGSWRTIMAYAEPNEASCNCPRVPRWSTPAQTLPDRLGTSRPLGLAGRSDEVSVIKTTAPMISHLWCPGNTK